MSDMEKIQIYLRKDEFLGLRRVAERSERSMADLVREARRKFALRPQATGPAAIWDGQPIRSSLKHDTIHDEL